MSKQLKYFTVGVTAVNDEGKDKKFSWKVKTFATYHDILPRINQFVDANLPEDYILCSVPRIKEYWPSSIVEI